MVAQPQREQVDESLSVYRRLVRDGRISHGAFRLWHYLRDRANKENVCFPQQRTIAVELHCKPHSLSGWIKELVACGYLAVEVRGTNHHFVYTILYGFVLPEQATRGDAQTGNANPVALSKPATSVLPISASGDAQTGIARVAQMGNVSNNNEVISISKGETPESESIAQLISRERQRKDWSDELRAINEELKGRTPADASGPNSRKWIETLIAKRGELRKLLGRVV